MSGEVAGGGNGVIGAKATTVMATQPDNIADEQERCAHKCRQRRSGRAEEPQFASHPDHHQRDANKGTNSDAQLFQTRPDHGDQQRPSTASTNGKGQKNDSVIWLAK